MSSASMNAEITLKASGAGEVVSSFDKLKKSSADVGKNTENIAKSTDKAKKETKGLAGEAEKLTKSGSGLGEMMTNFIGGWGGVFSATAAAGKFALDVLERVNAGSSNYKEVDFSDATDKQRALEDSSTRLAFQTGENYQFIYEQARDLSDGIGESMDHILGATKSFADLTYSGAGTMEVMGKLGEVADQSGRKIGEIVPIAVAVGKAFGTSGKEIETSFRSMDNISQTVGNAGGLRAFQDTIVAISPQLEHYSMATQDAKDKTLAFIGILGKGLSASQAKQVGAQAAGRLPGIDAYQLSKALGYDVLDEHGHMKPMDQVYKDLKKLAFKKYGKGSKTALWALRGALGNELGSEVFHKDLDNVDQIAKSASDKQERNPGFISTQAGGRNEYDTIHENVTLNTGFVNLRKRDYLQGGVKNMSEQVNKEVILGATPGFLKDTYKFLQSDTPLSKLISENKSPLDRAKLRFLAGPDYENSYDYTAHMTLEEQERSKKKLENQKKEEQEAWNKVFISPQSTSTQDQKSLQEFISRASAEIKALPNNLKSVMQDANFYVKQPLVPPPDKQPGNSQGTGTP